MPSLTDPVTHSLTLLGTFPKSEAAEGGSDAAVPLSERVPAILRIEKTTLPPELAHTMLQTWLERVQLIESNDIVSLYTPSLFLILHPSVVHLVLWLVWTCT